MAKTVGKQFEADFAASVPKYAYFQRLKDPAQAFGGGSSGTRFSLHNPYDCLMYAYPHFFALELKTADKSMTFWRSDFENSESKQTFNIKKHQIIGLQKAAAYDGVIAGFVLNFRNAETTYFVEVNCFVEVVGKLEKKSINQMDVLSCGFLIPQRKLKVNFRYDLDSFVKEVTANKGR